jgi:hypothetical protein
MIVKRNVLTAAMPSETHDITGLRQLAIFDVDFRAVVIPGWCPGKPISVIRAGEGWRQARLCQHCGNECWFSRGGEPVAILGETLDIR